MIFYPPLTLFALEVSYIPALAILSSPLNEVSMEDRSTVYKPVIPSGKL